MKQKDFSNALIAVGAKCSKAGMGKLGERKGVIIFYLANLL